MRTIRTAALAAAVLALPTLAACGGSSPGRHAAPSGAASHAVAVPAAANAVDALDVVQKRIGGTHSVRIETTLANGTQLSETSKGTLDWAHTVTGSLTFAYTGGTMAQTLRNTGTTGGEIRYLPEGFYVNSGPMGAKLVGGEDWISYTYADLAKYGGGQGSLLKDVGANAGPTRALDLELAAPEVKAVGRETVRGVPTVHYRGTLDGPSMVRKIVPQLTAAEWSSLKATFTAAGISTETVDLWVSDDHLPVKTVSSAATKTGQATSTTYYSDFGVAVDVQRPPAADTVSYPEVIKRVKRMQQKTQS